MSVSHGRIATVSGVRRGISSVFFIAWWSVIVALIALVISVYYLWPRYFEYCFYILRDNFSVQAFMKSPKALEELIASEFVRVFREFLAYYGYYGIAAAVLACFSLAVLVQFWFFRRKSAELFRPEFVRGSRLLLPKEFKPAVMAEAKRFRTEFRKDTGRSLNRSLFIGVPLSFDARKMQIPQFFLPRNMMLVGVPGTGKSTILSHALERARKVGEKCFIIDPNGEFYSKFGRPEDKILSLYDKRAERWEAHQEFHDSKQFNFAKYAEFLVAEGGGEKIWWGGAREVLKFLFSNTENMEELKQYILNLDKGALKHLEDMARGIAGAPDSKQEAGVAAGALLELSFLFDINHWAEENGKKQAFSVYDWAQNESRDWVFVTYADDDKNIAGPLLRIWTNLAIFGILARSESTENIPVNVIVDEMGDVGALDMLASAERRFRKYGGQLALGFQSISQFYALYPKNVADDMLALIGIKIFMRVTNPAEAKAIAGHIGIAEVFEPRESHKIGDRQQDLSVSGDKKERYVAYPDEIRNLPDGHFYMKCLNIDPVKSRVKYKVWPGVNGLHKDHHGYPPHTKSQKFRQYINGLSGRERAPGEVQSESEKQDPLAFTLGFPEL